MYSTAHVKGKRYTCFSHGRHAGYMQIDYTFHTCDYYEARGLHATCNVRGKSTPAQPTEVFVL